MTNSTSRLSVRLSPLLLSLLLLPFLALTPPHVRALTRQRGVRVRELTDQTFEHDTQASTGQTTGRWLVMFVGEDLDWDEVEQAGEAGEEPEQGPTGTLDIMRNVMAILSEQVPREFLFATVDIRRNPALKKRFGVTQTPTLKLFRDRGMFTIPGEVSSRGEIQHFLESGFVEATLETVPPAPSRWDEFREVAAQKMKNVNQRLAHDPLLLIVAGAVVMTLCFMFTSLMLGAGKRKRPQKATKPAAKKKAN